MCCDWLPFNPSFSIKASVSSGSDRHKPALDKQDFSHKKIAKPGHLLVSEGCQKNNWPQIYMMQNHGNVLYHVFIGWKLTIKPLIELRSSKCLKKVCFELLPEILVLPVILDISRPAGASFPVSVSVIIWLSSWMCRVFLRGQPFSPNQNLTTTAKSLFQAGVAGTCGFHFSESVEYNPQHPLLGSGLHL